MAGGLRFPIDILLGDMSFVFPLVNYIYVAPIILIVFWLVYKATKNVLYSNKLSWTHIILTIATSLFIFALPFILTNSYQGLAGKPRRYYDYGQFNSFNIFGEFAPIVITVFFIAAVGHLIYFVNLFVGLYQRVSGQNNR
ncbi:MAG TPA: hypothetical protein VM368_02295 [Flavisolibacter sp.]|nr:hypothetical protein [Flavisolibacter sp.]